MSDKREADIRMIPLDRISVVNPRERGKRKFQQIVNNIRDLGLKKPITVTPKEPSNGHEEFHLVCGQGRYEAYQQLGETEIPAMVVHVSKEKLLLMSLIENLARRQHTSIEMIRDIGELKERGYTYSQIAKKTALDIGYVRGMVKLLKNGEERLLQAVEKGQIPISVAVMIASSDDHQVQQALTNAYEEGSLRGQRLLAARRLVEKRKTDGKGMRSERPKRNGRLSSQKLLQTYQEETARQRLLIHKSRLCETRLLFVVSALRQLFEDDHFVTLLQAEKLDSLPAYLAEQIKTED